MSHLLKSVLSFMLISSLFSSWAQDRNLEQLTFRDEPLREVISKIEQHYNVRFSYISEILENKTVNGQFEKGDIHQLLQEILEPSEITFLFLDKNNIVLKAKNPPKIKTKDENFSIRGVVLDKSTQKPVEFASIVINNGRQGAVSDSNGEFEISNLTASTAQVSVHMIGYKKVVRNLNLEENTAMEVELEEEFVELEGIEITPGLFNISSAELKPRRLSKDEILYSPNFARDIYRTLNLVPGVSNTEFSAKARMRGGHSDETAIYLDNFELYEPFHLEEFDGVFSVINTDFVEDTKVLTGGFSPRYTDKISGILSVETPDNINSNETKISLDIINASLMRKQKISQKSSAFIDARRGYVDFLLGQVDGGDDQLGIEPIFYDLWGKYTYQLNNRNLLSLNVLYSQDKFLMNEQAIIRNDFFDSRRRGAYSWLNWKWHPNDKFYSHTTFGYQYLDKESEFKFESSISDDNVDNRKTDLFILNQNSIWEINDRNSFEFGLELKLFDSQYLYREIRTNRTSSTPDSVVVDVIDVNSQFDGYTISGYLQESFKLSPQLIMMAGLRVSNQSYGNEVTIGPRTALNYNLNREWKINLAYGVYFQPDNFQKTRSYIGQEFPFEEPSKSIHYTGSVTYDKGRTNLLLNMYFKDNRRLYDDFRLDFFNRIAGVSIIDVPFNTVSGTSGGFEVTARHQLVNRHLLSLTYGLARDRIKNADGMETYRDFDRRHSVIFNNVFSFKRNFKVGLLWNYHSGQPYTPAEVMITGESSLDSEAQIFYDIQDKNTGRLPDYHTLNLKVDKSWFLKKVELNVYLNVVNLYNRANVRNYTFDGQTTGSSTDVEIFRDPVEYFPRFITPGVSVKF